MEHQVGDILWNRLIAPGYWQMGIHAPSGFGAALPGQFVMVGQIGGGYSPLLRRPFSIHRLIEDDGSVVGIEILYRVVGQGTRLLAELKAGDVIDILGPLGRGFRIPKTTQRIYVAAGGIGVAPLVFLMDRLKEAMNLAHSRVFLGGRSRVDLLCRNAFEALGVPVVLTTDDGSEGDQCLLTHPLEEAVRQRPPDLIAACGPPGMISCVGGIASRFSVPCQVSLEAAMACGLGACLGCAVKPAGNGEAYLHVCKDGPVFDIDTIDLG